MSKIKVHQKLKISSEPVTFIQSNIIYFLLFAFAFCLYANSIRHNYALDDQVVLVYNKYVQEGFKGIPTLITHGYAYGFIGDNGGTYRPLPLAVFAVEKQLFGNSPHVHHFINVLLYAITAVCLFVLLRKILHKFNEYLPLIVCLLFIAHPIHTEVVANIKSRDELLAFLFLILSLISLFAYQDTKIKKYSYYSLIFFFLSLLSKENAIVFLAIIPLIFYFFYDYDFKKSFFVGLPFIGVSIVYLVIRFVVLDTSESTANFTDSTSDLVNNTLAGAHNSSEKFGTISYIMGRYIGLLIFPHPLSFDYSYNQIPIIKLSNIQAIIPLIISLTLIGFAFLQIKKKNTIAFCILFFFISMLLVSNIFVPIGATIGERFLFIPSLSFCIVLGVLVLKIFKIESVNSSLTSSVTLTVVLILILYSGKTIVRNNDWKDNLTLFTRDVVTSPKSARIHFALGTTLNSFADAERDEDKKKRMQEKAIDELKKSVVIYPKYTEAYPIIALTYGKLGLEEGKIGNLDKAIRLLHYSIDYDKMNASSYLNMGVAWLNIGNPDSAIYYIQKSISLKKDNPEAYFNLGIGYANVGVKLYSAGDTKKAICYYRKGLELNPKQANVYNNLKLAYNLLGKPDSANYYSNKSLEMMNSK